MTRPKVIAAAEVPDGPDLAAYQAGVIDGEACRSDARKPSIFSLLALGDAYSAGFRAGYFRFSRATPIALRIVADERLASVQGGTAARNR